MDDQDPADLAGRDMFYRYFGGMTFSGAPVPLVVLRALRVGLAHPRLFVLAARWLARMVTRAGGPVRVARHLVAG